MYDIPNHLSDDLPTLSPLVSLSPEVFLKSQPMLLYADILEQPDHLLIRINVPGARPGNIIVTLENNVLSVAAKLEPRLENLLRFVFICFFRNYQKTTMLHIG